MTFQEGVRQFPTAGVEVRLGITQFAYSALHRALDQFRQDVLRAGGEQSRDLMSVSQSLASGVPR